MENKCVEAGKADERARAKVVAAAAAAAFVASVIASTAAAATVDAAGNAMND